MLGVNDEKDQSEYEMFDITKCANDIFVCSIPGCVNELFYCLLKKYYIIKTFALITDK